MSKLRVVYVGGTKRAVALYHQLLERKDIEIVMSIFFMQGYEDEIQYCNELTSLAIQNNIEHVVSDVIIAKGVTIGEGSII